MNELIKSSAENIYFQFAIDKFLDEITTFVFYKSNLYKTLPNDFKDPLILNYEPIRDLLFDDINHGFQIENNFGI